MGLVFFSLWLECERPEQVEPLAAHFEGLRFQLLSGREITWSTHTPNHPARDPYLRRIRFIEPPNVNYVQVVSPQLAGHFQTAHEVIDNTDTGIRLFHHLQSAPDFFYGRVALDPDNIPSSEINDFIDRDANGVGSLWSCVVSDNFAERLAPLREDSFYLFRPGYIWSGYGGEWFGSGEERFNPLHSRNTPEIGQLYSELFPNENR